MEQLWTPWRGAYVTGTADEKSGGLVHSTDLHTGCIFCDKPRQTHDRANLIVARGETCFVILNAFPYNNGHFMVVPYRHLSDPADLSPNENAELMQTASYLTGVLRGVYRPDGYNIGMNIGSAAGAGIAAHLHLHVVPRWGGDTNFMPVLGQVKVLPETLDTTFDRITAALAAAQPTAAPEAAQQKEPTTL